MTDTISRKALIDFCDKWISAHIDDIDKEFGFGWRKALEFVKTIPSTESEGEAYWFEQYKQERDLARGQKEHLRAENDRLRAAHASIKQILDMDHSTFQHYQIWSLSRDALISSPTSETAVQLRSEVKWFAEQMELVLQANDYKGGWKDCSPQYLFEKLDEEVGELSGTTSDEETIREAADIANIAMMIADLARGCISGNTDSNDQVLVSQAPRDEEKIKEWHRQFRNDMYGGDADGADM